MALTRLLLPLFLLSLLVLGSANYEQGSTQNPHINIHHKPEPLDHHHSHRYNLVLDKLLHNLIPRKSGYEHERPQGKQNFIPTEPIRYDQKPKPEGHEHDVPTKPFHEEQKINHNDQVHEGVLIPNNINFIGIQGIILCESGSYEYWPLEGAKARITCSISYHNGYSKAESFSISSPETDEHGFFLIPLSVSELTDKKIKIQDCEVFLEYSPLESCNVPINSGLTGAHISLLHAYTNKVYYSVGSLIYKSETHDHPVSNDHLVPNGY